MPRLIPALIAALFGTLAPTLALAESLVAVPPGQVPAQVMEGRVPRTPCADADALRRPFFGDLHVHTAFSLDASTMGTLNRPADAYRFARGEAIGLQPYDATGQPMRRAQLARPLDFAAVTDHAELLGEWNICNDPKLEGHSSLVCRIYRSWPRVAFFWMNFQASRGVRHDFCGEGGSLCIEAARAPWQETREAAEAAYDRSAACQFTSFHAYEWTGAAGSGVNFHRNVIFANEQVPEIPLSFIDSPDLYAFWDSLERDCVDSGSGCDVVVIPHNTNLGAGRMYETVRSDGTPITALQARARRRREPLVEVMQHKGDSECMLGLETEDELCQFEKLAMSDFSGRYSRFRAEPPIARQFVRNILKEGLLEEERLGVNPFRLGFIASTDTHLATPGLAAETASFPGHGGAGKPAGDALPGGLADEIDFNPGGLAVLWAEENSRSSLFAAMRRREAYGTSGPRMVVRFFGGWRYPDGLCADADIAAQGYAGGVPMGGEFPPRVEETDAPHFVVSAIADPGAGDEPGTPLQRIQIVKGWLEAGSTHERVYDVAGDPGNGASVDPATCETSGPGAGSLCSVWSDPDFSPEQSAFYYARVVENPTCRWSQRACNAAGVRCAEPSTIGDGFEACCSEEHRPVIQERAWTSPIWFRPSSAQ
jgi:hypothetical protein